MWFRSLLDRALCRICQMALRRWDARPAEMQEEQKKSKNQNLHFVPVLFLFVTGGVRGKFCEAGAVVKRCFCWFSVCMERRGGFLAVSMRSNLHYPKW